MAVSSAIVHVWVDVITPGFRAPLPAISPLAIIHAGHPIARKET